MNRRQFLKFAAAGSISAVWADSAAAHGFGLSASSLELVRVNLENPLLPPGFQKLKIAFMSDVHYGSTGVGAKLVEKAMEMAMAENPDVICFGGDLITGWARRGGLSEFLAIARPIRAPLGLYAVMGNHEFHFGESDVMREFERSGIRMLRNETVFLSHGRGRIPLVGLDNEFNQNWKGIRRNVEEIEKYPNGIVLQHTPDFAVHLPPAFRGAMLCGHTHGGQIILPIVRQTMTASRFGLRYVAGQYPAAHGVLYITRGVGAVLVPMRIGCPPEVTILEWAAANQAAA